MFLNCIKTTCTKYPYRWLLLIIAGYPWLSLGYPWLSLVILGYLWLSLVIFDLSLVILGYLWLSLVIFGYPWLYLVILGYLWISLITIYVILFAHLQIFPWDCRRFLQMMGEIIANVQTNYIYWNQR